MMDADRLAIMLPKSELHLHIEGTMEPEMMLSFAARNHVDLPYKTPQQVRDAYQFDDLQSFLNLYYLGTRVLKTERDFYELTMAYLQRAFNDHVLHTEIFFDPQSHMHRGIPFDVVMQGIGAALEDGRHQPGISSRLIMCFLRDLGPEDGMLTMEQAKPYQAQITAVGLDSTELPYPPGRFQRLFDQARELGWYTVAHAGEEGPAQYIWEAIDRLKVKRIDHGVRSEEDPQLIELLARKRIPLTMCPLSNVKLKVFPRLEEHNLVRLLHAGICVCINSDDPAYFGGYINDNFLACRRALNLSAQDIILLCRNSFEAAFLDQAQRMKYYHMIHTIVGETQNHSSDHD